jgi:hypothetical protein
MAAGIIFEITYGYHVKEGIDDLVDLIERAVHQFSEAVLPGAHLVDNFPWRESYHACINYSRAPL